MDAAGAINRALTWPPGSAKTAGPDLQVAGFSAPAISTLLANPLFFSVLFY
ncbi:MAG: hypothetical protein ACJAU5_001386 [Maricaulis maris]|jgi:hypothetical protein